MLKQIILEREVQAKEGNKAIPEGEKAHKKPTTQNIFSTDYMLLKACNLKPICWEKARSSGGQGNMSSASQETQQIVTLAP